MKFKEQLEDLLRFWECELEDRKQEINCENSTLIDECKRYISIIKKAINEVESEE